MDKLGLKGTPRSGAGRVYIEDMYADKAKKLYLKGLI